MVSYDEDPQLNWPVNKGDIDLLKDLFNPSRNDPGVSIAIFVAYHSIL